MDCTIELTLHTKRPLTEDALADVAEIGGAASGNVGEHRLETTLTVKAANPVIAAARACVLVTEIVPGEVIAVNAMTTDEADRRLEEQTELVGLSEVADMLGVSKSRVGQLTERDDFPEPIADLASGPVWRRGDLSTFADGWQRKAGRPRKMLASEAVALEA